MWNERQEIPNAQVKDAADQYDKARRILEAQGPFSGVLLPLLNTSIMAVELYLKALSAKKIYQPVPDSNWSKVHAEPQRGHELRELLDAIPNEIRERLKREFRDRHSAELGDTLSNYERLLMESRYPYEENCDPSRYHLGPLLTVTAFLCDFVAQMEPIDRIH